MNNPSPSSSPFLVFIAATAPINFTSSMYGLDGLVAACMAMVLTLLLARV